MQSLILALLVMNAIMIGGVAFWVATLINRVGIMRHHLESILHLMLCPPPKIEQVTMVEKKKEKTAEEKRIIAEKISEAQKNRWAMRKASESYKSDAVSQ